MQCACACVHASVLDHLSLDLGLQHKLPDYTIVQFVCLIVLIYSIFRRVLTDRWQLGVHEMISCVRVFTKQMIQRATKYFGVARHEFVAFGK